MLVSTSLVGVDRLNVLVMIDRDDARRSVQMTACLGNLVNTGGSHVGA